MTCHMPVKALSAGADPVQNRFCDVEIATTDTEINIRLICTVEIRTA